MSFRLLEGMERSKCVFSCSQAQSIESYVTKLNFFKALIFKNEGWNAEKSFKNFRLLEGIEHSKWVFSCPGPKSIESYVTSLISSMR